MNDRSLCLVALHTPRHARAARSRLSLGSLDPAHPCAARSCAGSSVQQCRASLPTPTLPMAPIWPTSIPRMTAVSSADRPLLVRIIEYTLDDPARPGHGELHRLVTTLLNPRTCLSPRPDPLLSRAVRDRDSHR